MKPISRVMAKEQGLTRYFTGKPCSKGHIAPRLISNWSCVVCHRNKVNNYYDEHPEKRKTYLKEWNKANPECSRRWRLNHPKEWSELNKQRKKRWCANNPERNLANWRNYHSRKKSAKGSHTGDDILVIFDRQSGLCANPLCASDLAAGYHVDHKTPLSRGGSNWPRNLQLLCGSCNSSKGTRNQREWHRCLGI